MQLWLPCFGRQRILPHHAHSAGLEHSGLPFSQRRPCPRPNKQLGKNQTLQEQSLASNPNFTALEDLATSCTKGGPRLTNPLAQFIMDCAFSMLPNAKVTVASHQGQHVWRSIFPQNRQRASSLFRATAQKLSACRCGVGARTMQTAAVFCGPYPSATSCWAKASARQLVCSPTTDSPTCAAASHFKLGRQPILCRPCLLC